MCILYIYIYIYIYILYIYSIKSVRRSSDVGYLGAFDTQKHCTGRQTRLEVTSGPPGSPRPRLGVTSGSPGSPRTRLGVTSGSLWGHWACPELGSGALRGHFGVTWLAQNSAQGHFGVTSGSLGSRKLGSRSLWGHLAQENSARSHFEITWLGKLGSRSLRSLEAMHTTIRENCLGATEL